MGNLNKSNKIQVAKAAFLITIPILMAFLFIGIAYGMMMESKGYNVFWSVLSCFVIYSGSGQFLVADLMTTGVQLINVITLSFFISVRHMAYGLSMIVPFEKISKVKRFYMIYALGDEAFSYYCSNRFPTNVNKEECMFFVGLFIQLYWIFGTAVGGLFGSLIKFNTTGIDFVLTTLIVTIFLDQWLSTSEHIPAATGILVSIVCLFIFGNVNFVLPSIVVIICILLYFRKRLTIEVSDAELRELEESKKEECNNASGC